MMFNVSLKMTFSLYASIKNFPHENSDQIESFDSSLSYLKGAVRAAITINGVAIVTLLSSIVVHLAIATSLQEKNQTKTQNKKRLKKKEGMIIAKCKEIQI